ncbi:unnamed protein product, partial [Mesorhabditis spiculigera]
MNDCGRCHRAIGEETAVYANKQLFHPTHLQCTRCSYRIEPDTKYFVYGGQIICRRCYLQHSAPKCYGCTQGIDGELVTAIGQTWHPACFKCVGCTEVLSDEWLLDTAGPMHRHCYWGQINDCQMTNAGPL